MTKKDRLKLEARNFLIPLISEHKKLIIFIRHVSRSGMMRSMKVLIGNRDVSYYINDLLGQSHPKNSLSKEYVKISGCGMDMTLHLADVITYALWPYEHKDGKRIYLQGEPPAGLLTGNSGTTLDWIAVY